MKKNVIEKTMFYGAKPIIFERAKELRKNMTISEKKLWDELNTNKIKGYRFKAQHPIYKFIADFYCHKAKLIIEVDGSIHEIEDVKERDEGRASEIEKFEIKILRFTNYQVLNNIKDVLDEIEDNLITKS